MAFTFTVTLKNMFDLDAALKYDLERETRVTPNRFPRGERVDRLLEMMALLLPHR